jgi:hypothetical protein
MSIGEKYGWDSIDPGQGQGYTEMFFDTSREYTSKNQSRLAANIVRTVNEINKFFNNINRSLQSTGLPGYTTDVWQGMGPSDDINQIEDLTQIISIAKKQGIEEGDSGAKYRVKSIGRDAKGDYYISPSTEKKVYKSGVNKGDHENPNTGEIKKKVAEAGMYRRSGSQSAYDRDYASGMGRRERDMSDESNLLYIYKDGRVKQRMVSNTVEREARAEGFRDTPEQALKMHGIIRSKFKPGKWVQKQGDQWMEVFPFGKPDDIAETATPGATSAGNVATLGMNPKLSPGPARGKKSYTGTPGKSGTKAPPQPKVNQPKTKHGTAVNALDMKSNIFGGGKAIKRK